MNAASDLSPEARVSLRGVAFLVGGYDAPGGMEGQARALAHALAGLGLPVTYVTTQPQGAREALRSTHGLIDVFRLPVLRTVDWATTLQLLEVFALGVVRARRGRLNAIYSVHHETGAIASRVGRAVDLPAVVKLACSGAFGDAARVADHADQGRIRAALRQAARVVAITADLEREATGLLGIDPARIERIPNGVDVRRFRPLPRLTSELRVVFVGRLSAQKRVDVLLRSFAQLRASEQLRARGLQLVLVGDGPLRGELTSLAAELGIADATRFCGLLSDPVPELREACVFALPSVAEGASNALLEALAMGIPSVATALPGTEELAGDAALLVPPGDVDALAAALRRVLEEPALAERLAAAGPERVAPFALEAVARRHLALFHQLAAPESGSGGDARFLRALGSASLRSVGAGLRSVGSVLRGRLRLRS